MVEWLNRTRHLEGTSNLILCQPCVDFLQVSSDFLYYSAIQSTPCWNIPQNAPPRPKEDVPFWAFVANMIALTITNSACRSYKNTGPTFCGPLRSSFLSHLRSFAASARAHHAIRVPNRSFFHSLCDTSILRCTLATRFSLA